MGATPQTSQVFSLESPLGTWPGAEEEVRGKGCEVNTCVCGMSLELLDPGPTESVFFRSLPLNLREMWVYKSC